MWNHSLQPAVGKPYTNNVLQKKWNWKVPLEHKSLKNPKKHCAKVFFVLKCFLFRQEFGAEYIEGFVFLIADIL